jgi:Phage capsid family
MSFTTNVSVTKEPRTYEQHGPHSFFRDLARYTAERDADAAARLERHQTEALVDRRAVARLNGEQKAKLEDVEYRTQRADVTLGFGGEFAPPLWMIEKFATAGRAGRVYADVLDQYGNVFPLPPGVQSIHAPRISTGSSTGVQADGSAVSETDVATAEVASDVVTIAGQGDVSQQLYDLTPQPGLDFIFLTDLTKAYNKNLETQLLTGTGPTTSNTPGAQINGLTNVSGIPSGNKVSGAGLSTIEQQWNALGQVAANVSNQRLLPPEVWLMAGRRYFWIASSVDNQKRPIASPGQGPHMPDYPKAGGATPFGPIIGLLTYLDGAIPAGASADTAYALRPSEMFLWESEPRFIASVNATAGTLQVRLSLHRYAAAMLDRYPSGIGWLSGLAQPTNF